MSINNNKDPSFQGDAFFQDSNYNNNNKDQPLEGDSFSQPLTLEAEINVSSETSEESKFGEPGPVSDDTEKTQLYKPDQPQAPLQNPIQQAKPAVRNNLPAGVFRPGLPTMWARQAQLKLQGRPPALNIPAIPQPPLQPRQQVSQPPKQPPLQPRQQVSQPPKQPPSEPVRQIPAGVLKGAKRLVDNYSYGRNYIQRICRKEYAIENSSDQVLVWQYRDPIGYWVQIDFNDLKIEFKKRFINFILTEPPLFSFKGLDLLEFFDRRVPALLRDSLEFKRSDIKPVKGLNFKNGFLVLDKLPFELILDKDSQEVLNVKNLMLTHYLPYEYDSRVLPSTELLLTLLEILNNDLYSLFKLRCLLKMCLEGPFMKVQTGFFLWGSPASGKSTLVNFLMELVGKLQTANLRPSNFPFPFLTFPNLSLEFPQTFPLIFRFVSRN